MSEQVPPADDSQASSGGPAPTPPPPPEGWNTDGFEDLGDLHGYLPHDPPPLGTPSGSAGDQPAVPPPPPTGPGWGTPGAPPPPSWGTPGQQPPQTWGTPGGQPPAEWGTPAQQQPTPPPVPSTPGWTPMPTGGLSYGSPIQFGTIPLRPLGLGEMIEGSFRTFRRYPGTIFTFGLVLALFQLLTIAPLLVVVNKSNFLEKLQKLVDKKATTFPTHWTDYSDVPLSWFGWSALVLVVGAAAIYLIGSLAYSHVAGEAAIGTSVTAGEVWRLTRRQLWRGIGMIVLLILVLGLVGLAFALVAAMASLLPTVGGALALLTILASYVVIAIMSIRFMLAPAVLALEDVGPLVALRRSFRLVRGSSWRVFGYFIVAYLISAVISFAVSIPFNLIGSLGNGFSVGGSATVSLLQVSTFSMFMQLLGQVVATAVTLPYLYIFLAYLYTDLRMRRENLASVLAAAAEKRNR